MTELQEARPATRLEISNEYLRRHRLENKDEVYFTGSSSHGVGRIVPSSRKEIGNGSPQ
jgi:hypothetical protein